MWRFKQYLINVVEAGVKDPRIMSSSTKFYHEGVLKSYSTIVQILLKRYATDGNIVKPDA